ncbi:type VII secretion integral membrane protein EccD [Actinoplanes sp. NPDC049596]|uniref:type VII secretion integral membrane protein EccD n=1 Tax=unclassified Actinoplanes TaxID=2626549 RepID=UPI003421C029
MTVVGAQNRVDLAVPAGAPIAEYTDELARLCGQPEDDALPPAWSLAPAGAAPFPLSSSLAEQGVEDGAVLYLRDTLAGEEVEPVVHSVWELVSEYAGDGRGALWNARSAARLFLLLGALWLVAAVGYLGLAGFRGSTLAILAGLAGVGVAVLARLLRAHPRVLPDGMRTLLGCAAVPCTALAALFAPGDPALDLTHLTYVEIGLVVGLIIALIAVPDVMLGAVTLLVAIAGVLLAVLGLLHASVAAIAATVVVAGVLFLSAAPRTAGLLVATSWLSMSSPTLEPDADPDRLSERVDLAHRVLTVLVGVTSLAVGVALIVLNRAFNPFTLAVAVVATVVLFVRTTSFRFTSEAIGPVVAAVAGLFGLLTLPAHSAVGNAFVMPILFLGGLIAIGTSLPMLLWRADRAPAEPDRPSRFAPLLTIGQIALPALLLGVYGLYGTLWDLGR